MKFPLSTVFALIAAFMCNTAWCDAPADPYEKFRGHDPDSTHRILYDDLNKFYKFMVVNTGRSTREVSAPSSAPTGSKLKTSVRRKTNTEGNRFYFEYFRKNEENREVLEVLLSNFEAIPGEVPLDYFSRDEQLAYWLNLYNLALINEITKVYPKRSLKKVVSGRKSVLDKKLLEVAGIPLSLNEIQKEILNPNYDNNPLVMYGLYQGIIGGPNIRKSAYTGLNVWRNLRNNAEEFINSNRGTFSKSESVFRASNLYERNQEYFPDFQPDLKKHLLVYLESPEKGQLEGAGKITPDIDDWNVTDLFGSQPTIGASFADNSAALLGATQTATTADGRGTDVGPGYANATRIQSKAGVAKYVSPELMMQLMELKARQDRENQENATVTVEELGEVPTESESGEKPEPDSGEHD